MPLLPLGAVKCVTPGTLVQATFNRSTATDRVPTQSILFQALPANVGVVYVGIAGLVRATLVNCIALLPKPSNSLTGPFTSAQFSIPFEAAGMNAADFFIDADTAGDGVLVSVTSG